MYRKMYMPGTHGVPRWIVEQEDASVGLPCAEWGCPPVPSGTAPRGAAPLCPCAEGGQCVVGTGVRGAAPLCPHTRVCVRGGGGGAL
jgi:hypothetical protein